MRQDHINWSDSSNLESLANRIGVRLTENNMLRRCLLMSQFTPNRIVLGSLEDLKLLLIVALGDANSLKRELRHIIKACQGYEIYY